MSPLNRTLYYNLKNNIGPVTIIDEGCALIKSGRTRSDGKTELISAGEYYRVNCPFCHDTRQRLWINHRWGVYDPDTGTYNRWLAICYNEDCLSNPDNREQLVELTSWYYRRARAGQVEIAEGRVPPLSEAIPLPDDFIRLCDLPKKHPAVGYVLARGFDPLQLSKRWLVGFSKEACSWSPEGRLVIPIFGGTRQDLKYRGWQARAITPDDYPKYHTAHGMKKSEVLYGLHRVTENKPVVIVEGPTDVWRLGRNAVALLGKSASSRQLRLLREHCQGRPLVVLLDPDAAEDASRLAARLESMRRNSVLKPDSAPVVVARLPAGLDPADCEARKIWRLVSTSLKN